MNFDFIIKFIEQIKDLNCKRAFGLVVSMVIMLSVYKIDSIMPYVDKYIFAKEPTKATKGLVLSSVDLDVKDEHLKTLTSYIEQYATPYIQDFAFMNIYKYVPEGPEYYYQGRILVQSKVHPTLDERTIKELNLNWVPLWAGRNVTEHLFDSVPVLTQYDPELNAFTIVKPESAKKTLHHLQSVNTPVLIDLGIRYIMYYPIEYEDRIVGYISIYLRVLPEDKHKQLLDMVHSLSSRIGRYLVED